MAVRVKEGNDELSFLDAIANDPGMGTMSDPLSWSPISLGRWFGTSVRVHITLIIFVVFSLMTAAVSLASQGQLPQVSHVACWLGLLLLALALHELGHAVTAYWLDCDQGEVNIWPLGSLVGPSFAARSSENFLVAMAGLVTNGAIVLMIALGLHVFAGAQFVWNPFGNDIVVNNVPGYDAGAPRMFNGTLATPLTAVWVFGWFGYLNWVLMVANMIPALPFDGGRMLRAWPGTGSTVPSRESIAAPWTAHACAFLLAIVGLVRLAKRDLDGLTLIGLAFLIEHLVRTEARMLEDGGYFDDGVFGYDFSEGYTSLESGTPKVRPYRESALKRWRRRRSELRRQRRIAVEAAEERRMDEILQKLHLEGRSALTDEENRFLIRVSARYRNRTKNT
jgi:stage IV sporulation protein FB